jgi:hypothetical protein
MVCSNCGKSEVSITEEVYRHSNRLLHGTIIILMIVAAIYFIGNDNVGMGMVLLLAIPVYRIIVRIYAGVRSHKSKTKCICLNCGHKWYIG